MIIAIPSTYHVPNKDFFPLVKFLPFFYQFFTIYTKMEKSTMINFAYLHLGECPPPPPEFWCQFPPAVCPTPATPPTTPRPPVASYSPYFAAFCSDFPSQTKHEKEEQIMTCQWLSVIRNTYYTCTANSWNKIISNFLFLERFYCPCFWYWSF